MAVTIRQVAQEAGVSTAAVSKVLHGRGQSVRVSEERAVQIREVAARLNYRPNALARQLRMSRTHTVGLVFENFVGIGSGPLYYVHMLDGVGTEVFSRHYRLTILAELADDDIVSCLSDSQLEGVIWCKLTRDEKTVRMIHECPIPIVALNASAPETPTEAVFVACDNDAGIELAVDHLWQMGHRHIAFLHEEEEHATPDTLARKHAYEAAMTRRNGELDVLKWSWSFDELAEWWAAKPACTAVIAWSERAAGQFLRRAHEIGLRLPDELSLIGFDSTPFCDTTTPRLTAVRQPITDMAGHAARILFDLIDGRSPDQHSFIFPCTLDVRDSTAIPRLKAEEAL